MSKSVRDIAALAIIAIATTLVSLALITDGLERNRARSAIDPATVTSGNSTSTAEGYYCRVPLE